MKQTKKKNNNFSFSFWKNFTTSSNSNEVTVSSEELQSYNIGDEFKIPFNLEDGTTEYQPSIVIYKDEFGIGVTYEVEIEEQEYCNTFYYIRFGEDGKLKILKPQAPPVAFFVQYHDKNNGFIKKPISYFQLKNSKIGKIFKVDSSKFSKKDKIDYYENIAEVIYKTNKLCLIKFDHLENTIDNKPYKSETILQLFNL